MSAFPPTVRSDESRFVELAVAEKKLVVVALVPVAFEKVKFWRVVEPTTSRSPEELMVEVAEPPIESELPEKMEEKRLLVVVALVPVAFEKVKFWRVEEAVERNPFKRPMVVEVETP